jgi:hypothetical protein
MLGCPASLAAGQSGCDASSLSERWSWLRTIGPRRASVEQRVAEAYASLARLPVETAEAVVAFQSRVAGVLDEVRSAVGERCGDIWCDWNPPGEPRLKVGVAASGYPPAGAHVQAAKLVLKRRALLDASDFVEVSTSMADLVADLARVSAVLGDSGVFASASLRTESQSRGQIHLGNVRTILLIETVGGLTSEQQAIVEYAASLARDP